MINNIWAIARLEMRKKKRSFRPIVVASLFVLVVLFAIGFWLLFYYGVPANSSVFSISTEDELLLSYLDDTFFLEDDSPSVIDSVDGTYFFQDSYNPQSIATKTALVAQLKKVNRYALSYYDIDPLYLVYVNFSSVFREEILDENVSVGPGVDVLSVDDIEMPDVFDGQNFVGDGVDEVVVESATEFEEGGIDSDVVDSEVVDGSAIIDNSVEAAAGVTSVEVIYDSEEVVVSEDGGVIFYEEEVERNSVSEFIESGAMDTVEPPEEDELLSPDDLQTFSYVKDLLLFIQILFVLNVVSGLFGTSMFEEKINQRSSLLFIGNVKHFQLFIGKSLPYFMFGLVFSMILLGVKSVRMVYNPFVWLIMISLLILYLGLSCLNALISRSTKEYSFLNVFTVSGISLYLLIPAFLSRVSEISYASLLTPLLLYSQKLAVDYSILLFVLPLYFILGALLFILSSYSWDPELLFSFDGPMQKILILLNRALFKAHHFFVYAMSAVAVGWLLQLSLIAGLLTVNFAGKLFVFLTLGAFIEEVFRNLGVFAVMRTRPETFKSWKSILWIAALTGFGFMIAEKGLLLVSIAPFLAGYELLVFAGLIVPFLMHTFFTFVFILLLKASPSLSKRYLSLMFIFGVIHALLNFAILTLTGVAG